MGRQVPEAPVEIRGFVAQTGAVLMTQFIRLHEFEQYPVCLPPDQSGHWEMLDASPAGVLWKYVGGDHEVVDGEQAATDEDEGSEE